MKINCFVLVLFLNVSMQAQEKKVLDSIPKKKENIKNDDSNFFKAQLSYTSNYSYNGRVGTSALPYIAPYIGYFNKNGFNVSSSLYYSIAETEKKVEALFFDVDYDYDINDKLTIGIYANKSFYADNSIVIASSIKGYAGVYLDYDFDFINLTIENTLLISKKADFSFAPKLYKEINLLPNKSLKIIPTLLADFSSLNYYEDFTNVKGRKKANSLQSSITEEVIVNNKKITFLDYQISLATEYKINNLVLFAIPTLSFPLNPVYTTKLTKNYFQGVQIGNTLTTNSTEQSELNLKNNFFLEIGAFYKF